MNKRLLLISNSFSFSKGYLGHCIDEIFEFLGNSKEIVFIPYALYDRDAAVIAPRELFKTRGINLLSVHTSKNPKQLITDAKAIFIGGGNTFRLLNELYKNKLTELIRNRVENGMSYIGSSAGANVACPTIKTTNDMPIVYPPSLDALDLVPFQINPHYIDPDPDSKHKGETREQRIKEYHEENDLPVIGLREESWLRIESNIIGLKGENGARVFIKDKIPKEYKNCIINLWTNTI